MATIRIRVLSVGLTEIPTDLPESEWVQFDPETRELVLTSRDSGETEYQQIETDDDFGEPMGIAIDRLRIRLSEQVLWKLVGMVQRYRLP